jgi:hypothetical protein
MRSRALMTVALRVMGNLVTDEESARAAERGFALHVERAVDLAHAGSVADAYELQVRALLVQ